jgi:hypothetical protein
LPKDIYYLADYQLDWARLVPPLRVHHIQDPIERSILGEAPKDFVLEQSRCSTRARKHWVGYIAKVGAKRYPTESITEQLMTRLGLLCGLRIANSKLAFVDGQLRFLSQYFLRDGEESLVHGAEIFEPILTKELVQEIADKRRERDFYTFQMVEDAVKSSFPDHALEIMRGFVKMLAFDALVGNQDRHFYNWAIVTPVKKNLPPRFSPIYDTARGLFWNMDEPGIKQFLDNPATLEGYINRSHPMLGWDEHDKVKHFELIQLVWDNRPEHRSCFHSLSATAFREKTRHLLDREFKHLMSNERRELIKKCLVLRHRRLCAALSRC